MSVRKLLYTQIMVVNIMANRNFDFQYNFLKYDREGLQKTWWSGEG